VNDYVTMVFHMSDGSTHPLHVPRDEVDSVLLGVAEAMRENNQLLYPTAKMLFNGAHIVAVVPKVLTGEQS
jgi:hypothetical protein